MISIDSSASNKQLLLVCNAAEDRVQLVLGRNAEIVFARETAGSGRTMQILPQAMESCFRRTGISPRDLDGLAYVRGPGTFTGLRVSIALCTGLAKGADIPVAGLDYLPLIAAGAASCSSEIWVCTYARKGLVYVQGFSAAGSRLSEIAVCSLDAALEVLGSRQQALVLLGSGVHSQEDFWRRNLPEVRLLESRLNHPSPAVLLKTARQASYSQKPSPPLYLRASDAEVNIPQLAAGRGITVEDFKKSIPDFLRNQA